MGAADVPTTARAAAPARSPARRALWLLQREHRWLFDQLTAVEAAGDDDPAVADRLRIFCNELAAHRALEHKVFYPALDTKLSDTDAVRTAQVEHQLLDRLSARLLRRDPGDPFFRPLVRVLRTVLRQHVATEEGWFAEAREVAADWPRLIAVLQARQHERRRLPRALTGGNRDGGAGASGNRSTGVRPLPPT
jgi:hypothetical protein